MFIQKPFSLTTSTGDAPAYVPKGAMWFDSGDGTELNAGSRSSDSSNKKRNIISVWRKGSYPQTTNGSHLIGVGSPDYDRIELAGSTPTQLQYTFDGGGSSYSIVSDAILRDPTGWQHLVISFDSTRGSGSRINFFYNGVLVSGQSTHSGGEVPADFESELLGNSLTTYLCGGGGGAGTINSYISEFIAIDGKSIQNGDVAISAFGIENSDGVWVPVDPTTVFASGSDFGNNGFYLDFADSSDFGNDVSKNNNDFTSTNTTTANWTYDRPADSGTDTGNYCILDPNQNRGPGTLSNAYLTWSTSSTWAAIKATIPCLEDGCYWEATCDTVSGTARQTFCGLMEQNKTYDSGTSNQDRFVANASGAMEWYSGSGGYATITGASALSATDVLMFAYKNGSIWVGKNGTWFTSGDPDSNTGAIETGLNSVGEGRWTPSTGQNYTGAWTFNFGGSDFAYPPGVTYNTVGFNPINTSNLPAPSIIPSEHFQVVLVDSHSQGVAQTFTLNWSGDTYDTLFIVKRRDTGTQDWYILDTLQGIGQYTVSPSGSSTGATSDANIISISGTTITLGTSSSLGSGDYVIYAWRAGDKGGATNTDGTGPTETVTVSANTTSGFSIVKYEGTGSNMTIGHGLSGKEPKFLQVKGYGVSSGSLSGAGWQGLHMGLGAEYGVAWSGNGNYDNATYWQDTAPTGTVFSVGTGSSMNKDSTLYIAYLWAEVENFSSIISYDGNGSTEGPVIQTGFSPALVITHKSSTEAGDGWMVWDYKRNPSNEVTTLLQFQLNSQESTPSAGTNRCDFFANSWRPTGTDAGSNASSTSYVEVSFAEMPFGGSGVAQAKAR
jgi:hypothetical protein